MFLSLNRHFDMYIKNKLLGPFNVTYLCTHVPVHILLCLSTQSGGIKSTKCSLVSATRPSYLEDMITILHFQAGKCRKTLTCWSRVKAGSSRHKGQTAQLWNRWEATISVVTMSHHDHKDHQNTNHELIQNYLIPDLAKKQQTHRLPFFDPFQFLWPFHFLQLCNCKWWTWNCKWWPWSK